MKRHTMTAARKAALRKAQLASARKRKGKHKNVAFRGIKLSSGHKKAIAIAVAGTALAGGSWGVYNKFENEIRKARQAAYRKFLENGIRRKKQNNPNNKDMTKRRVHDPGDLVVMEQAKSISFPSREVKLTTQHKTYTTVRHPIARAIMSELNATPVKGYYAGIRERGNYKVIFGEGVSGSK